MNRAARSEGSGAGPFFRLAAWLAGWIVLLPAPALAAWPSDPLVNLPVCVSGGVQDEPAVVSDGTGGVIIVWSDDHRDGNVVIAAQRVDSSGALRWAPEGVAVSGRSGLRRTPRIVSDGAGGAIVAWEEFGGDRSWDVAAQRIGRDGTRLWTEGGVPVSAAPDGQVNTALIADGRGGAIVAWEDRRTGASTDIYAQRVSAQGRVSWTADGVPVCVAAGDQLLPLLVTDGAGGAIACWQDQRTVGGTALEAQHVGADGQWAWATDGVVVCDDAGADTYAALVPDGAGGAIAFWDDGPILAQRIDRTGVRVWARDGVQISSEDGAIPEACADRGGAIVVWQDLRGERNPGDIFVQRVGADGKAAWDAGGVAVCRANDVQTAPAIAGDGAGGVVIAWEDRRDDESADIYGQRVNRSGRTLWTRDGVSTCTASGGQLAPALVSDGVGGAIVVWRDEREGEHIYAQRIGPAGALGGTVVPDSERRPPRKRSR